MATTCSRDGMDSIQLPDGTKTSVLAVTATLKKILPKQDRSFFINIYRDCFKGSRAVDALMKEYKLETRVRAVTFGKYLQEKKILHHVKGEYLFQDASYLYRLQCFNEPDILNSYRIWTRRVDTDVMGLLHRLFDHMTKIEKAVTNEHGKVDYKEAHKNLDYESFEEAVCELQGVKMKDMNEGTKLAFGINLYNLMIKYSFMKIGISTSNLTRLSFFSKIYFNLGGQMFSFNDLENGILRSNSKPPYSLSTQFKDTDPRVSLILKKKDCRIHFALNCGAQSCPPVRWYNADFIDAELTKATHDFCADNANVNVSPESNQLRLTMLLNWFQTDFVNSQDDLPEKVATFLSDEKKEKLQKMINSKKSIGITFFAYDWSTNASDYVSFSTDLLVVNKRSILAPFAIRCQSLM